LIDLALVPAVLLAIAGCLTMAMSQANAARPSLYTWLLAPYVVFSGVSIWRMWRDGTLLDLFRARRGDVSLGGIVALVLGAGAFAFRQIVTPRGSRGEEWLMRLYLQLGEVPEARLAHVQMALTVIAIAVMEEIVWRGMVQQILEERLGTKRGWLLTSVLYALAYAPTVWLLAMPAGKNWLVVIAALFSGTVWGFFVGRMQRLPPMLLSHALFSYFVLVESRLWSM
jgi:membrane protease YdiL (CAAX protease family)